MSNHQIFLIPFFNNLVWSLLVIDTSAQVPDIPRQLETVLPLALCIGLIHFATSGILKFLIMASLIL